MADKKPTHVKPNIYTFYFIQLKEIAREHGYNLVLHGSLNRDLDLILIPWTDEPCEHLVILQEFDKALRGFYSSDINEYMPSILPGGRHSYVININRGGKWNNYHDEQYYLDISITPMVMN